MTTDTIASPGWRVDESVRDRAIAEIDFERLLDSPQLQRITEFASALCGTPVALVTLIERDHQQFIARTGIDETGTPRDIAFCAHAIQADEMMVVPDATQDARFADNPLVTGDHHVRFYAGVPLANDAGVPLGTLCVLDRAPRDALTPLQEQGLAVLAEAVMTIFDAARG